MIKHEKLNEFNTGTDLKKKVYFLYKDGKFQGQIIKFTCTNKHYILNISNSILWNMEAKIDKTIDNSEFEIISY